MTLSIIIPVHNEERFISETLGRIFETHFPVDIEVIVVDDGSTDGTAEILASLTDKYKFILTRHETNLGKGSALRTGFNMAHGDLVVIQDADLEYHPFDILKMLEVVDIKEMIAIYGDRRAIKWPKYGYHYVLGSRLMTATFNLLYKQNVRDLYTGYKLFRRADIIKMNLQSVGFEFEAEVSCKFVKCGGRILNVPISYSPRNVDQGKHIGAKDALTGLLTILKNR